MTVVPLQEPAMKMFSGSVYVREGCGERNRRQGGEEGAVGRAQATRVDRNTSAPEPEEVSIGQFAQRCSEDLRAR
jgi:hypothetical protein